MSKNYNEPFASLRNIYSEVKKEFLTSCTLCGECLENCPVYPLTSFSDEDYSDVQRKFLDALSGLMSEVAVEMAYACSGCDQCIDSCPMGLNPFSLKEIIKEEVVNNGLRTPPGPLKIGDKVIDLQELLGSLQISPDQKPWLIRMPDEPVQKDTVLFLGCSVRYQPDKGLALIELMEMAGIDYIAIQGGELCCGGMYVRDGDINQGNLVAGKLISSLLEFKPRKIVFSCSSCYKRVCEIIDTLDVKPFQLQHASTLLSENMHRLKFSNRIEKTVTLHDPCDLRWKRKDTDAVRKLLGAIPGVTFKEMRHNRESSLCCGIGSHDKDKQISKELRKRVLDEAEETGAHIVATVCTGCHNHFCRAQNGYSFEITHYMSLMANAVGHPFEDKIKKYLQFETINEIMEDAAELIEKSPYTTEEFKNVLPIFFRSAKP